MGQAQWLLPEIDEETANTRKVLDRVPEDKPEWRPHPKSMKLSRLAQHVAETPSWGVRALNVDSFDVGHFDPARATHMTTRAALLEAFDGNVRDFRAALEPASDELLMQRWTLLFKGKEVFSLPRIAVIRKFGISHMIHHRGQLSVYLRLLEVLAGYASVSLENARLFEQTKKMADDLRAALEAEMLAWLRSIANSVAGHASGRSAGVMVSIGETDFAAQAWPT